MSVPCRVKQKCGQYLIRMLNGCRYVHRAAFPCPPVHGTFAPSLDYRAGQARVESPPAAVLFQIEGELSMKKAIFVGLAILAVSTSGALAKKASKPKAPAAATATTTTPTGPAPFMMGQVSAADRELYAKSQRESGMKK